MISQKYPIGNNFKSEVVQENLKQLFEASHEHQVMSSLPTARQGSVGDVITVDDGTNVYLCTKTSRGWFRTSALTAI